MIVRVPNLHVRLGMELSPRTQDPPVTTRGSSLYGIMQFHLNRM